MRTILFKGLLNIRFRSHLPSPPFSHPSSPSTLPHVCHVTFSQRAHSDLVHRQSCWCELCVDVSVCVPLLLFFQIPLTLIQTKSESAIAYAHTSPHRHVITLSCWAQLKQQSVNKCAFMYNVMPCIHRHPRWPVCLYPL